MEQIKNQEKKPRKCHTVRTTPKSRKTENTTLSEQFQNLEEQKIPPCQQLQNLEKQKIPHCQNNSKI
jgi:hypothetical protein